MSWTKIDDGLHGHRKVAELLDRDLLEGLAALGLWTLAMSWCGRELTDGRVPARQPGRLAGGDVEDLARRLVDVGLWEEPEPGAGYQVHEYLEDAATGRRRNPSRAEVLADREAARRRMEAIRAGRSPERSGEQVGARTPDVRGLPNPESRTRSPSSALTARERDGLLSVTDSVDAAWREASGRSVLASGKFPADYIDDACRRHPEGDVLEAIRVARGTFATPPATQALAAAVRGILDPLPSTLPRAGRRGPGRGYLPSSEEIEAAIAADMRATPEATGDRAARLVDVPGSAS